MIDETQRQTITRSWRLVVPIKETAADLFYRRLFELAPEYRPLFGQDMAAQRRKLISMLSFIVKSLDFPDSAWRDDVDESEDLMLVVVALGRRHRELYRVPDAAYATVGEALLWTLDYGLGDAFTDEVRSAWAHVYQLVSTSMRMGATSERMGVATDDPGEEEPS